MVPTWQELFGVHGAFFMYACICSLVALICFFFMPETSGMSLEAIEEMYKPKNQIVDVINAASVGIRTADPVDKSKKEKKVKS